ncbi:MAG: hypothetical protein IJY53_09190, partial [Akkermansia sp.]|nr:hypothetical protein [Akkermansia sp.]
RFTGSVYYLSVRVVSLAVGSLHHSLNKMTPRRAGLTKFRSPAARHPYKLVVVGENPRALASRLFEPRCFTQKLLIRKW